MVFNNFIKIESHCFKIVYIRRKLVHRNSDQILDLSFLPVFFDTDLIFGSFNTSSNWGFFLFCFVFFCLCTYGCGFVCGLGSCCCFSAALGFVLKASRVEVHT